MHDGCGGGSGSEGDRRWNKGEGGGTAIGSQGVVPKRGGGMVSDQWGRVGSGAGRGGGAMGRRRSVGEITSEEEGEEDEEGGVSNGSCCTSGATGF